MGGVGNNCHRRCHVHNVSLNFAINGSLAVYEDSEPREETLLFNLHPPFDLPRIGKKDAIVLFTWTRQQPAGYQGNFAEATLSRLPDPGASTGYTQESRNSGKDH